MKIIEEIFLWIEFLIRNLPGWLGRKIRYLYYKYRLGKCGKNVIIDTGVHIQNPKDVYIGDNVWIDKNVILIAGKLNHLTPQNTLGLDSINIENFGKIKIGSNSHIGINTIIQGHGGVVILNNFTCSAHCKIYTLSNDVQKSYNGTFSVSNRYILNQIFIEENVWLGLNVSVIKGKIQKNSFIKPNSVVVSLINENSIAEGFPAREIKKRFE
ncbi:MAG: acyltransferase [Bacteroidia bacterium]